MSARKPFLKVFMWWLIKLIGKLVRHTIILEGQIESKKKKNRGLSTTPIFKKSY